MKPQRTRRTQRKILAIDWEKLRALCALCGSIIEITCTTEVTTVETIGGASEKSTEKSVTHIGFVDNATGLPNESHPGLHGQDARDTRKQ